MNDIFAGYACIFNHVDLGNDVIMPKAFEASLREKAPQNISMLWQHDPNQPIGRWEEMKIDQTGLFVVGRLSTDTSQGHDVAVMIEDNVVDGLSIGFKTRRAVQSAKQAARYIHEIDLWEISVVTFPMQLNARIKPQKTDLSVRIGEAATALRA